MPTAAPDGTLRDWSDIADEGWSVILGGNGLSINFSRYFAYQSLYEEATKPRRGEHGLSDEDRAVFDAFGTTNFEVVMARAPRRPAANGDQAGRRAPESRRPACRPRNRSRSFRGRIRDAGSA